MRSIAHAAGALLAVDSTVATPVLTRPIELGADIVMHSGTKYLNGHSDLVAGVLVTARDDDFWSASAVRAQLGGTLGSFEAWLLLRGMRTLHLRVRARRIGAVHRRALRRHPRVEAVLYPGLPSSPGHAVAARQMENEFGYMLSVRVRSFEDGGEAAAIPTAASVKLWKRATSLGGVESLIEHRASNRRRRERLVPPDLLRLSAGLEDADGSDRRPRAAAERNHRRLRRHAVACAQRAAKPPPSQPRPTSKCGSAPPRWVAPKA